MYRYTKRYLSVYSLKNSGTMFDYMRDVESQQLADITYAKKTFGNDDPSKSWQWIRGVEGNTHVIHWDFIREEDLVQFKLARG